MPRRKILRDGRSPENQNENETPDNQNDNDKSLAKEMYGDAKEGVKDVVKNVKNFAAENSEYLREFGLTMVYIKASGLIFFSLIMFVVGLIAILNQKPKMIEAEGTVFNSVCKTSDDKNATTSNCNFQVKFKDVENKEYTVSINTNTTKIYTNNEKIKVYYDPKDPQLSASIETDNYSYIIYILMIVFGVTGFISAIVWIFLSRKYGFVAKAEGLKGGVSLWNRIFYNN